MDKQPSLRTNSLFVNIVRVERSCQGVGGSHVTRLNFKTSRVSVYKHLSLIVSFAITVAIWPREVVSCRIPFYAMSLVGIYSGRTSVECLLTLSDSHNLCRLCLQAEKINSLNNKQCFPKGNKHLTSLFFLGCRQASPEQINYLSLI